MFHHEAPCLLDRGASCVVVHTAGLRRFFFFCTFVPTRQSRPLTLQRALLGTIALALLAGIVPAWTVLDRRIASTLEGRARSDLRETPRILSDRQGSSGDAMMMHAKEFAHTDALAVALSRGDRDAARRLAESARAALGGEPVVFGPAGTSWFGVPGDSAVAVLISRTQRGEMPVATVGSGEALRDMALAPVQFEGRWVGAVGLSISLDAQQAAAIAGVTHADAILVSGVPWRVASTTLDTALAQAVVASLSAPGAPVASDTMVGELSIGDRRLIVVTAPLRTSNGRVVLVRDLTAELSMLPELRWIAFVSAAGALLVALLFGFVIAGRIARPVGALARAADALARGDFDAQLPTRTGLSIREVDRVETAFATMRAALAARLAELAEANGALADRNARLSALQADLVQRERLAATGRLVAQLAHEIRNPVASLRNCLELIRRRVTHDSEALEFTDLAIDELLRMHELAEQLLDLNRPRPAGAANCRPAAVAREVAALLMAGVSPDVAPVTCSVDVGADGAMMAAIDPDVLKQVLLNLAQNGREAVGERAGTVLMHVAMLSAQVCITVRDDGDGIAPDVLPRIFDPFFTTKREMRGVGLGLFIAEGLVRAAGGTLTVESRPFEHEACRHGASFQILLPLAEAPSPGSSPTPVAT